MKLVPWKREKTGTWMKICGVYYITFIEYFVRLYQFILSYWL